MHNLNIMPIEALYLPLAAVLSTKNRPGLLRRVYNMAYMAHKTPSINMSEVGGWRPHPHASNPTQIAPML